MRDKIVDVLRSFFTVLITLCMVAAFVAAVLFITAMIMGGSWAASVCAFIGDTLLPAIYVTGTIAAFIGIISMYANGEKDFVMNTPSKKK